MQAGKLGAKTFTRGLDTVKWGGGDREVSIRPRGSGSTASCDVCEIRGEGKRWYLSGSLASEGLIPERTEPQKTKQNNNKKILKIDRERI